MTAVVHPHDHRPPPGVGAVPSAVDGHLRRRSRLLVGATVSWNVVEAGVALSAGAAAGSAALISFGLDAAVEVSAALVALWYLQGRGDARGRAAGRLIAASFWALALWVLVDAATDVVRQVRPESSLVGIGLTAASLAIMPVLARAKRRTARALGSRALESESAQTQICAYLSAAVLAGLVLNGAFGWWWADPAAAVVIGAVAAREGLAAWRGGFDEGGCC